MTYEEYKNKKSSKKNSVLKNALNKLFTIIIFILLVMIMSNISPKFRNFVNDKVLNSTIDFSVFNKFTNKLTDVFKMNENIDMPVSNINNVYEKYKDGVKYKNNGDVILKNSGIITFIGEKEGYGNTVIVQQSNGYYAWYGNINENVKLYDYVEKGEVIGTTEEEYYYVLYKDDKVVNIDEY